MPVATGRRRLRRERRHRARTGLLIDWGGVLTTNLFASFHAYCLRVELDPQLLAGRFREDPEARELLIALEKGEIDEPAFEQRFAALLGVAPDGLIDGLFTERRAGPCDARRRSPRPRRGHPHGARVELLGRPPLPHELFDELFDGIVISGELGIRKPSRRMYELGAERAGVPAEQLRLRRRPALQPHPRREARHGDRPPHERRDDDPRARSAARHSPARD